MKKFSGEKYVALVLKMLFSESEEKKLDGALLV